MIALGLLGAGDSFVLLVAALAFLMLSGVPTLLIVNSVVRDSTLYKRLLLLVGFKALPSVVFFVLVTLELRVIAGSILSIAIAVLVVATY